MDKFEKPFTHKAVLVQDFLKSTLWGILKDDLQKMENSAMNTVMTSENWNEVSKSRGILETVKAIPRRIEALSQEREK
jgi:hypothetical protein